MESIQEQIEYGSYCMHGVAIGTPGGADLMCVACEEGLTHWVEDPTFELWAIFVDGDNEHPIRLRGSWLESTIDDKRFVRAYSAMRRAQRAFEGTGFPIVFEVRRAELGYWDYPDPLQDLADYYEQEAYDD